MLDTGEPHRREKRYLKADGTSVWASLTVNRVALPGEAPTSNVAVVEDITEQRRTALALAESDKLHRLLFQLAPSGVVLLDSKGNFVAFNDQACQQLGYQREEFARLHLSDIDLNELAPEMVIAHFDRIFASGGDEFEASHRTKSGHLRRVLVTSRPVQIGGLSHLLAVWQDVTERRQAEARFRALIERSSDMILVFDAQGRSQFGSQNTTDLLGFTAQEIVGSSLLALVHEADRETVQRAVERLLSHPGTPVREEIRFRNKAGLVRNIEASARNLLGDPAVQGVVVNCRDVTEQRELESQLRQAQKLESVGRLAGGVAHDFNNLLTVILGCSESMAPRVNPSDTESLIDLEQIHAAGERARDLTSQLLAFARKQIVNPVALDLNSALRKNEKMLGRLLGEDIDLEVKLEPSLGTILADPSQLEQVILNLAVNARDAMPKGGKLEVETRSELVKESEVSNVDGRQAGDWVQLIVRDSGSGMTPEVRSHLFEPFFTTKEQGKGTGLGLATVYGIVTQAGGHVHVESTSGEGSTFQVCFPRAHLAPESTPSPVPATLSRGTERILVVEDEALVRKVLVQALASEGYEVTAVGHPKEALDLPEDALGRTQLLLTDVIMPAIDGHTLARKLVSKYPRLKVLYLSGYTQDSISERGVLDNGVNFLAKPFTRSALLAKVRSVLDIR